MSVSRDSICLTAVTLSPRTVSIVIALFLSGSFIALGYYFSSPLSPRFANAESAEALLKAYAEKDTDADGLPDWQEALYGTDPQNASSAAAGMTDAEAVASGAVKPKFASEAIPAPEPVSEDMFPGPSAAKGSFTERFSQSFIQQYLSGGAQNLETSGKQALVANLLATFSKEAQVLVQSSYTASSVRTSSSLSATAYAAALESVFASYDISDDFGTVASLSDRLVTKEDESARPKLRKLQAALEGATRDFTAVEAPAAHAADHLILIRSFDTLAKIAALMVSYEDDPVAALGALGAYAPASEAVLDVWRRLAKSVLAEGEPSPGSFAAEIVDFSRTSPE